MFDFVKAEKEALKKAFLQNNLPFSDEACRLYHKINDDLWLLLERGKISKPEIQLRRFREFFAAFGIVNVDPVLFNRDYVAYLSEGTYLIDGAAALCETLSKKALLAIVTNGVAEVQKSRIGNSKITEFISFLFVSEAIGYAKPEREYFEHALCEMKHPDKSDVLIVGDSLVADIKGGLDFGIDTCWVNPGGYKNKSPYVPKYEIARLCELPDILSFSS